MRTIPAILLVSILLVSFSPPTATAPEIEMVLVEGGTFQMGSNVGEKNEKPVHAVTLNSFFIGKYEVTQAQWFAVTGKYPSHFTDCPDCPVEEVTVEDIDTFLIKLNDLSGKRYRLPTEAEWEYAAIGGNKTQKLRYPGSNIMVEVSWMEDNSEGKTHPVGQKRPNELDLYDMSGNVWELCADWFDETYYKHSPAANPCNTQKAKYRVVRGGSWRSWESRCYSKARNCNIFDHYKKENFGLRVVLDN
jgi:formylglycine-generating enzyme required for sulfatase activity